MDRSSQAQPGKFLPRLRERTGLLFRSWVSEYDTIDGKKVPVWFAADESRPLLAFAGIWTNWTSVRKTKEGEITADIYGVLTRDPNAEVGKVHPKAMPVILTKAEERDVWMRAP